MLSDDRPTDPAWLPIFSKEEHFMGNAFGMISGLEPDEWSNDACRGYVIIIGLMTHYFVAVLFIGSRFLLPLIHGSAFCHVIYTS